MEGLIRNLIGSLDGLKPQQLDTAEKILRRRVDANQTISLDLARELCEWSAASRRRIGVLIDRQGRLEAVLIGEAETLELPEDLLSKAPAGGRLRGLRWIATGPFQDEPRRRDLTNLARARLDLYIQLAATEDGRFWSFREAALRPADPEADEASANAKEGCSVTDTLAPRQLRTDFSETIQALEEEFERRAAVTVATNGVRPERVVLVTVGTETRRQLERRQSEIEDLVLSAGGRIVARILQSREALDSRTLIGEGCVNDLVVTCVRVRAELVVFNANLSGGQARALEEQVGVPVLDRTQIILDLFAQSARSSGGKLQVELARLRYALPRLSGHGEGLSQIGAASGTNRGIGSNRGVGEKQLELDRRALRRRIQGLEGKVRKLKERRAMRRARRARTEVHHVALVGYTNAGKSSLFNRLTGAHALTDNRLFSTLDPTVRRRRLESDLRLVFSDTVGFIEDLPEDLFEAFAATLEELKDARLLLHVVDSAAPDLHLKVAAVRQTLERLALSKTPQLLVFNKIDLVQAEAFRPLARTLASEAKLDFCMVSAQSGVGTEDLVRKVEASLLASVSPAQCAEAVTHEFARPGSDPEF